MKDKRFDELYMLPAAQTKDKTAISPEQVKDIILELKKEYEYVIIDCPAGIEQGFKNAIAGADQAIVVTTPEHAAVRDADRIIGLLENSHIGSPKLVVNRIKTNMVKSGDMLDIEGILQVLNIDLIGIVPDDEMVIKAANSGEPTVMNPSSSAAIAYRNIARRILGDTVPLMLLDQKSSVFKRFKKFFGMG
ncbi:Septum site-determining protein MinD [compost metagenome]